MNTSCGGLHKPLRVNRVAALSLRRSSDRVPLLDGSNKPRAVTTALAYLFKPDRLLRRRGRATLPFVAERQPAAAESNSTLLQCGIVQRRNPPAPETTLNVGEGHGTPGTAWESGSEEAEERKAQRGWDGSVHEMGRERDRRGADGHQALASAIGRRSSGSNPRRT
ncbi:MAG: hypothetical protein K0R61_4403 [Microvirga sp.]|nr:hypothetical protein [Microvirga sp.]